MLRALMFAFVGVLCLVIFMAAVMPVFAAVSIPLGGAMATLGGGASASLVLLALVPVVAAFAAIMLLINAFRQPEYGGRYY